MSKNVCDIVNDLKDALKEAENEMKVADGKVKRLTANIEKLNVEKNDLTLTEIKNLVGASYYSQNGIAYFSQDNYWTHHPDGTIKLCGDEIYIEPSKVETRLTRDYGNGGELMIQVKSRYFFNRQEVVDGLTEIRNSAESYFELCENKAKDLMKELQSYFSKKEKPDGNENK